MQLLSWELSFCFSPNAIACAAFQMYIDEEVNSQQGPDGTQPCLDISRLLNLSEEQSSMVQQAKAKLVEQKQVKLDPKMKKEALKYLENFSKHNSKFWYWMGLYNQH